MKRRKYRFIAEIRYSTPTVSRHPMEQEYDVNVTNWMFRSVSMKAARRWAKELERMPDNFTDTEVEVLSVRKLTKKQTIRLIGEDAY